MGRYEISVGTQVVGVITVEDLPSIAEVKKLVEETRPDLGGLVEKTGFTFIELEKQKPGRPFGSYTLDEPKDQVVSIRVTPTAELWTKSLERGELVSIVEDLARDRLVLTNPDTMETYSPRRKA